MVQTVKTNVSGISRPGVFVNQTYIGGLPQPLASHAIGYIFVSTEADDYLSNKYSGLEPYVPTQIGSVEDYVRKSGGVPTKDAVASTSYHAVKAFFDNAGSNAILYATRVTATPEVVINVPTQAGAQYKLFTLKINGRYYGSFDMETVDSEGVPIKAILTTGLDSLDNAYDIFEYLTDSDPDFSMFFEAERTSSEVTVGEFRIYSKSLTSIPKVEEFRAYKLLDSTTPDLSNNVINILTTYEDSVKSYFPIKNLGIKLNSNINGYEIKYVSGYALAKHNAGLLDTNSIKIGDFAAATNEDLSDLLRDYFTTNGVSVAENQYLAISKDNINTIAAEKFPDSKAGYVAFSSTGELAFGGNVPTGDTSSRTGYIPESVQVAYVNIAGENRVLISNGATPDEITQGFVNAINEVFVEKGIDQYYDVEPELINYADLAEIVPNNGYNLTSNLLADHGYPALKPGLNLDQSPILLSSGSTISSSVLTSSAGFRIPPYKGMVIYRDSLRLVVESVTSGTQVVVKTLGGGAPVNSATVIPAYVDNSEANGFYIYDFVSNIRITSKNGTIPPIFSGINRFGFSDSNVVLLPDLTETIGYSEYKYSKRTKASDYSYAIRQAMASQYYAPGYILIPEAFAHLVSDGDTYTKAMALEDRIKVISAISTISQGIIGNSNIDQATQFVGLIDCGGDIESVTEATDELNRIKSVVGAFFGHLAYYAPAVINEEDILVPASAYVAGIACSRNVTEGFQQPPAGIRYPLRGALGLKFPITSQQQEITYALGLNAIRALPNKGIVVWGARTLSSNPLFKFINTRVILNVLIDAMSRSFDDILFEQIDSGGSLYSRVIAIASAILNQFYRQGALFGNRPEQAYAIVCNDSNNTPELLEQGTVRCDIYVATSPTLERIIISIARTPAGQVAIINDSFSRNIDRFQSATQAQNLIV